MSDALKKWNIEKKSLNSTTRIGRGRNKPDKIKRQHRVLLTVTSSISILIIIFFLLHHLCVCAHISTEIKRLISPTRRVIFKAELNLGFWGKWRWIWLDERVVKAGIWQLNGIFQLLIRVRFLADHQSSKHRILTVERFGQCTI